MDDESQAPLSTDLLCGSGPFCCVLLLDAVYTLLLVIDLSLDFCLVEPVDYCVLTLLDVYFR